jgi:hypothetical protein
LPSLRDLTDLDPDLGSDDSSVVGGGAAPLDVLARVKAEGMRRRVRRRRRTGALVVLGVAVLAVPAAALLPSGSSGRDSVTAASDGESSASTPARPSTTAAPVAGSQSATTVESFPTTAVPPVVPVPVPDPDTELGPAVSIERELPPQTTVPETTVPPPAPPPNQPLVAGFVDTPSTAAVGEEVLFTVAWSDPDAQLTFDHFSTDGVGLARGCTVEQGSGQAPPEPVGGGGEVSYTHTFDAPGVYTVVVSLGTGDCSSPYGNDATVETTVTVS